MAYTVKEIVEYIGASVPIEVKGNQNLSINKAVTLEKADSSSLVWIKPGTAGLSRILEGKKGILFVCNPETFNQLNLLAGDNCFLITEDPRHLFSKITAHFFSPAFSPGIHPTAFIHPEAVIGNNCFIGPFCYVGKSVLGDNVILHGHCFIYDNVIIGNEVQIHAGTVIGSDGFGYIQNKTGKPQKFPQLGGVIIEDNVEIGANTCIDRGSLDNTIIRKGVKIDNLVHIAHNVVIGENSFIIAHAMIGGSTVIGKNAWVSPSASILQQLNVGENSLIGMGAVVLKDVPANEVWAGIPAKKIKDKDL